MRDSTLERPCVRVLAVREIRHGDREKSEMLIRLMIEGVSASLRLRRFHHEDADVFDAGI